MALELPRFYHIPEPHHHILFVGDFNAHGCFPWDWGFYTDIRRRKVQLDIVCKVYNFADFDTHLWLHFVAGHTWAAAYVGNGNIDAKIFQGLL